MSKAQNFMLILTTALVLVLFISWAVSMVKAYQAANPKPAGTGAGA